MVNSYFLFGVAGLLAVFIRAELAQPGTQFFGEERYNQLFTMHGTTMIFLFVIPMLAGFGNYIVPLQIGALDMAFPRVNALSFWMLPLAGLVLYSSYLLGGAADAGWTQYAPLSEGVGTQGDAIGIDLWIVGLLLVGTASHPWRGQLHHHDLQDARAGHDDVPDAAVHLDHAGDLAAACCWRCRCSPAAW